MNVAGDVLMSTRELGCRRTNYQAEKYLSKVIGQLDVEKHIVERDWDRQMKTLILQKQKRIPKVWENKNKATALRPRSAWEGRLHKNYILTRPQTVGIPQNTPSAVPSHWHFLASYTVTPDGRRIPNNSLPSTTTKPPLNHRRDLQSARPVANAKNISIKPRRATSAPVRRSGLSTCIVTQLPTFNEELGQLQHQEVGEGENDDVITNGTIITPRKKHQVLEAVVHSEGEGGLGKLRPQSAVASAKGEYSSGYKVNRRLSRNKYSSHSNLDKT